MNPSRRALLGAGFLVCAPSIVRAQNLMPIHSPWLTFEEFLERTAVGGHRVVFSWAGLAKKATVTRINRLMPHATVETIGYGKRFPQGEIRKIAHDRVDLSWPDDYRWREGIRL